MFVTVLVWYPDACEPIYPVSEHRVLNYASCVNFNNWRILYVILHFWCATQRPGDDGNTDFKNLLGLSDV